MQGFHVLLDAVRRAVGRLRLPPRSYTVVFGSVAEGRCGRLSDIDLAVRGSASEKWRR